MKIFKILKIVFSSSPGWIEDVNKRGRPALAVLLADPLEKLKKFNYWGIKEIWIDAHVMVKPVEGVAFEAQMKLTFSQAIIGKFNVGRKVGVMYNPDNKQQVFFRGDFNSLVNSEKEKVI